MSGKLYVVGTPIGNLGDVTNRGGQTLAQVDFICAEDTRVTAKLLHHAGIQKPLVSYFDHSTQSKEEEILRRIEKGESAAIVTDAGMPCISDPGQMLVRKAKQRGIEVLTVPGPSAVVAAVSVSGILNNRFVFEGFLHEKKSERMAQLAAVATLPHTLVYYCAPHKLVKTLADMEAVFGPREIALCRELTKKFEETCLTTLPKARQLYQTKEPRGEYVLVVAGAKEEKVKATLEEGLKIAKSWIAKGEKTNNACKLASQETGLPKRELYSALLKVEE